MWNQDLTSWLWLAVPMAGFGLWWLGRHFHPDRLAVRLQRRLQREQARKETRSATTGVDSVVR